MNNITNPNLMPNQQPPAMNYRSQSSSRFLQVSQDILGSQPSGPPSLPSIQGPNVRTSIDGASRGNERPSNYHYSNPMAPPNPYDQADNLSQGGFNAGAAQFATPSRADRAYSDQEQAFPHPRSNLRRSFSNLPSQSGIPGAEPQNEFRTPQIGSNKFGQGADPSRGGGLIPRGTLERETRNVSIGHQILEGSQGQGGSMRNQMMPPPSGSSANVWQQPPPLASQATFQGSKPSLPALDDGLDLRGPALTQDPAPAINNSSNFRTLGQPPVGAAGKAINSDIQPIMLSNQKKSYTNLKPALSGNQDSAQFVLSGPESPRTRKRREREERIQQERQDLEKMMNYDPFSRDPKKGRRNIPVAGQQQSMPQTLPQRSSLEEPYQPNFQNRTNSRGSGLPSIKQQELPQPKSILKIKKNQVRFDDQPQQPPMPMMGEPRQFQPAQFSQQQFDPPRPGLGGRISAQQFQPASKMNQEISPLGGFDQSRQPESDLPRQNIWQQPSPIGLQRQMHGFGDDQPPGFPPPRFDETNLNPPPSNFNSQPPRGISGGQSRGIRELPPRELPPMQQPPLNFSEPPSDPLSQQEKGAPFSKPKFSLPQQDRGSSNKKNEYARQLQEQIEANKQRQQQEKQRQRELEQREEERIRRDWQLEKEREEKEKQDKKDAADAKEKQRAKMFEQLQQRQNDGVVVLSKKQVKLVNPPQRPESPAEVKTNPQIETEMQPPSFQHDRFPPQAPSSQPPRESSNFEPAKPVFETQRQPPAFEPPQMAPLLQQQAPPQKQGPGQLTLMQQDFQDQIELLKKDMEEQKAAYNRHMEDMRKQLAAQNIEREAQEKQLSEFKEKQLALLREKQEKTLQRQESLDEVFRQFQQKLQGQSSVQEQIDAARLISTPEVTDPSAATNKSLSLVADSKFVPLDANQNSIFMKKPIGTTGSVQPGELTGLSGPSSQKASPFLAAPAAIPEAPIKAEMASPLQDKQAILNKLSSPARQQSPPDDPYKKFNQLPPAVDDPMDDDIDRDIPESQTLKGLLGKSGVGSTMKSGSDSFMANDRDDEGAGTKKAGGTINPYEASHLLRETGTDKDLAERLQKMHTSNQISLPEYKGIQKLPSQKTTFAEDMLSKEKTVSDKSAYEAQLQKIYGGAEDEDFRQNSLTELQNLYQQITQASQEMNQSTLKKQELEEMKRDILQERSAGVVLPLDGSAKAKSGQSNDTILKLSDQQAASLPSGKSLPQQLQPPVSAVSGHGGTSGVGMGTAYGGTEMSFQLTQSNAAGMSQISRMDQLNQKKQDSVNFELTQ